MDPLPPRVMAMLLAMAVNGVDDVECGWEW